MNENVNRCPKCQAPLPEDAPQGLCAKCLLEAVSTPTEAGQPAEKSPPPPIHVLVEAFPQLEIIELIGHGGMGVVYKARQPKLDRFVALKLLSQSLATDPAFAERFHREARVLARLNHPNIVAVYDYGEAGGFYYLLMEYVDGINLRQALQAGRFTPQQALALVPKICEALQFAHEEGILHRDIKPENILLDTKGRIKIADFGIAKLLGDKTKDTALTVTGAAIGTPQYMAPEQLEHRPDIDQRADIYSLGVVFYEMLTGELPMGRFAPPSEKTSVDPRVDEVVLRALEKERERRYRSAGEVRTQVEHITGTPGQAPTPPPPVGAPVERRSACYFSTPEHMGRCFRSPGARIFLCKGELILDAEKLTFSSTWGTPVLIPLNAIQDLSIGTFKLWHTPWMWKYEQVNFLSATFLEGNQRHTYHLTPVPPGLASAGANDAYIAEWFEAIQKAVIARTGVAPHNSESSNISVSAQGNWLNRFLLVFGGWLVALLLLPHAWIPFLSVVTILAVSWLSYSFLQANSALARGNFDGVTSGDPPRGPGGTVVVPGGGSGGPPPKRRRFWRYALWALALLVGVPALLAAVLIPLIYMLRSHNAQPLAAGPPMLLLEPSSARDAARFPGLQTFRWRYSIPTNHVAVFSFTVWSNGVPSLVHSLSLWQAAGPERSAKGSVQWSVQDGVMLSPELQNQERWDFKREATDMRGTSTESGTVWTRGVLGSGNMRATRDHAVRLRDGESAELLSYGETNVSVQVRFEPMPPGVSAGPQGMAGKGTNWVETFGQLPEAKQ